MFVGNAHTHLTHAYLLSSPVFRTANASVDALTLVRTLVLQTGMGGIAERAREQRLKHMLEAIVMIELHPRSCVEVVVQEIEDDGALFASAVNASCLAMMDAGVAMRKCAAGAECAAVGGQLVLDPTAAEEKESAATMQLAYSNDATVDDMLLCNTVGLLTQEQLAAGTTAAYQATKVCFAFFRRFAEQRLLQGGASKNK